MREIKFRAWDRVLKEIWYPTDNNTFGLFHNPTNELMQFTGLLDKNEKEIWEGDILKYSCEGIVQAKPMVIKIPDIYIDINNNDPYLRIQENTIEIIGNIYENPELLEKII